MRPGTRLSEPRFSARFMSEKNAAVASEAEKAGAIPGIQKRALILFP
jgi:hypothetical protein